MNFVAKVIKSQTRKFSSKMSNKEKCGKLFAFMKNWESSNVQEEMKKYDAKIMEPLSHRLKYPTTAMLHTVTALNHWLKIPQDKFDAVLNIAHNFAENINL
jgi:RAB protein geranylgeranyltransferase component A